MIMLINTAIFKRYLVDPTVNKVRKVVETHWVRIYSAVIRSHSVILASLCLHQL